jgi:hypothetical protein
MPEAKAHSIPGRPARPQEARDDGPIAGFGEDGITSAVRGNPPRSPYSLAPYSRNCTIRAYPSDRGTIAQNCVPRRRIRMLCAYDEPAI